jgi:hypothetical protein
MALRFLKKDNHFLPNGRILDPLLFYHKNVTSRARGTLPVAL